MARRFIDSPERKRMEEEIALAESRRDDALEQIKHLEAEIKGLFTTLDRERESSRETFAVLRSQLEDMRRQRDRFQSEAGNYRNEARRAELRLERALGWIDCKQDVAPGLGEIGFEGLSQADIDRMFGK